MKLQISSDELRKACIASGIDNIEMIEEIIYVEKSKGIYMQSTNYDEYYTYQILYKEYVIYYDCKNNNIFAVNESTDWYNERI